MPLFVNSNTGSLYAQQVLNTNARGLASVMQQLSSGKRINNSVDDVAGNAISTRLTSQIRGLNQAVRNVNDGISLIQTAEGATELVANMLQRMRELAVQSSNDTNNTNDRSFLDKEFQHLKLEINRASSTTQWNGSVILDGTGGNSSDGNFFFQAGTDPNQTIGIKIKSLLTFTDTHMDFGAINGNLDGQADLSNLCSFTNTAELLGRTVSLAVDNQIYRYTITQADIDTVGTAAIESNNSTMATQVVSRFASMMASGTTNYSVAIHGTNSRALDFIHRSGVTAAFDIVNNKIFSGGGDGLMPIVSSKITTGADANAALGNIESAMQGVNSQRSNMGAIISRLQFASDNLANVSAKAQESRSRIEDTDYSQATGELVKRNIIQQAAQAMLAQANQAPQLVLQLLK